MNLQRFTPLTASKKQRGRLARSLVAGTVIALALLVSIVSFALAEEPVFPDVASSSPFYTAIHELADRSIVAGYDNGDFGPNDSIMRQQFAKMIVLTAGYPVSEGDICPFPDVAVSGPDSLYPDNYVAVAAAKAITVGTTATTFSPYANITRYQVISMVVRTADSLQPGLLAQQPAEYVGTTGWGNDSTHGANAARAEYNGLLAGLDLNLSPYAPMTRGEVAQVLYNLLMKVTPPTTTTTAASTTTSASTTTTLAASTTTSASTTTTAASSTTTTTVPTVPEATDYTIAGPEQTSISATVRDQFGNPLPNVEVFFTGVRLEGNITPIGTLSVGTTNALGMVAHTWGQALHTWGVEKVMASVDNTSLNSVVALIQWIYDDTDGTYVSATSGQTKVVVHSGFTEWNGNTLSAYLNPGGVSLGSNPYVSSADLNLPTSHTWASGQGVFVRAASTNTDNERNWIYSVVP